ncbi:MAG TPA: ABC transporter ATP-binding protein [Pirellulales bacterium]|nr:ABC transporter ATP-binding protein [Pirellulales bacterium]
MPLLDIRDLHVQFHTDRGVLRPVDGLSLAVEPGETVGLVGESGSGKSMTSLAVMGLVPPPGRITAGQILFEGRDLRPLAARELARIRGNRIAMVFQDPMTSLNPFLTVAEQLAEVTRLHLGYGRRQAIDHAVEMLGRVGIPGAERRVFDYPHQFSGGMRQRVMIAMALSCRPQLLIADEPTTALDVTIQAQILELIVELQQSEGMAVILITHDLGVVANSCKRVAVMYAGRLVEQAPVDDLFAHPKHPYTLGLLESIPRIDAAQAQLTPIPGQPPDLLALPQGCKFEPRCSHAIDRCKCEDPPWFGSGEQRFRCFNEVKQSPADSLSTKAT